MIRRWLAIASLGAALGCAEDECKGLAPAITLEVVGGFAPSEVRALDVELAFGGQRYGHRFDLGSELDDGRTSLRVALDPVPAVGEAITIRVRALGEPRDDGAVVARAEVTTPVEPNACNVARLDLTREPGSEDAAVPDSDLDAGFGDARDGGGAPDGPAADAGADAAAADAVVTDGGVVDPPWWNNIWSRRARIWIESDPRAPSAMNYIAWLHARTASIAGYEDAADLRVVRWDGQTWLEIPFIVKTPVPGAIDLWFPLQEQLASGAVLDRYYLYYAAPVFAAEWRGDQVFPFFDDFDTFAQWFGNGTITATASFLVTQSGAEVGTLRTFGPGLAVDFIVQAGAAQPRVARFGFQEPEPQWADVPVAFVWRRPVGGPFVGQRWSGGSTWESTATATIGSSRFHLLTIERFSDRIRFRVDGVTFAVSPLFQPVMSLLPVRIGTGQGELRFDWLHIRPVLEPSPRVDLDRFESLR